MEMTCPAKPPISKTCRLALAGLLLAAAWHLSIAQPPAERGLSEPAPSTSTTANIITHTGAGVPLQMTIGRSLSFKTAGRLRKVYVSNPKVLQSFTASPHQIVISAIAPGMSSVALWTADGSSKLYTITANLDIAALDQAMAQALPGQAIHVRAEEGRLYLSGQAKSAADAKEAASLAAIYSQHVVNSLSVAYLHPAQVRLQVRMVEVDRTKLDQFGFNFFSSSSNTATVSTQQFRSVGLTQSSNGGVHIGLSDPLNLLFYSSKLNLGATLANMAAHNVLQILAEPTITTVSGKQAQFLSGGEFPYPVIQGGAGNFASVTIMFQPYGVKLDFTPTVNPDGTILLKVAPEVSALDYSNAVTISGYTIPAISTRRAETEVELRNGESFSISGLLDHRTTVLLSKMPGIGDIPVLGRLFQSKNNSHSVVELMVIVTATVVDPLHLATHPQAPAMAVPNLKVGTFDRALPRAVREEQR